jgi:CRISPR-associated protein Cst2
MTKKMGLTATVIVEAQSLNYDEGYGNLSVLKKLRRASGEVFTYSSRQSLRYSIVKQGCEQFGWNLVKVHKKKGRGAGEGVLQAVPDSSITESEEIDLFGYMKTDVVVGKQDGKDIEETLTRPAVARITPAISLEPFFSDIEFLNSKWFADRANEEPNIANIEQHRSLYKYTITIDLDRVGSEEWNDSIMNLERNLIKESWDAIKEKYLKAVSPEAKATRIVEFLEVIKTLYRDIRGRREDLKPLFIIGGVYEVKNPFFMNAVKVKWERNEPSIVIKPLEQIMTAQYQYKENGSPKILDMKAKTVMGAREDFWKNYDKLSTLLDEGGSDNQPKKEGTKVCSPEDAINKLEQKVNEYYGVKNKGQS